MNHAILEEPHKIIIGEKEKVDFPDMGRHGITARIDTGAKSSSIHCSKIWTERIGRKEILCCYFLKNAHHVTRFSTYQTRKVKSSNGIHQIRYVVQVKIKLGDIQKTTQATLTNRDTMNYSVLLGRRFLSPEFLVDVSQSYILTKTHK